MALRYTEEQYKALTGMEPPKKPDKFRRSPKEMRTVDGIVFASLKEAEDYFDLKRREMAGEIRNLQLQTPFKLMLGGEDLGEYRADFTYEEARRSVETGEAYWTKVIADSKPDMSRWSAKTKQEYNERPAVRLSRLKRGLVKYLYGIEVKEL